MLHKLLFGILAVATMSFTSLPCEAATLGTYGATFNNGASPALHQRTRCVGPARLAEEAEGDRSLIKPPSLDFGEAAPRRVFLFSGRRGTPITSRAYTTLRINTIIVTGNGGQLSCQKI